MIWVSLFSNLGKKQGKGRTLGTILPPSFKRRERKIQKGSHRDQNVSVAGSFSPCARGLGGGGRAHSRQLVSSCPALASPALFWFGFAHAQRGTERGSRRGGLRNLFLHLQRTRQGREAGRPHCGRDGFRQGTKRSDAPSLGPLTLKPRRKGFSSPRTTRGAQEIRPPSSLFTSPAAAGCSAAAIARSPSPPPLSSRPPTPGPAAHTTPPAAFRPDALLPPAQASPPGPQAAAATHLPRGWSSRRPLLRLRPPLQMETVVPVARAAPLRLRPHSSSMPRAPQE